jgi:tetratricopeptide (TPR) repeat protein
MNQFGAPPRFRRILLAVILGAVFSAPLATSAQQVQIRSAPNDTYWTCFEPFLDGDFRSAAKAFREAARDGIFNISTTVPGPWIDAICYHAMIGECHYQMGNLPDALDEFTAALKFFLAHRDWMLRIDFPQGIDPEVNPKTTISWGTTTRANMRVGHFPPRYSNLSGNLNNAGALLSGGVVAAPMMHPVYAGEIVRCTSLALSRRCELMGPLCERDPLTAQLVDAFARLPAPPNHWSQCWAQLQLGLAFAASNRIPQAVSELQKSLVAAGQYDHPLTCVAFLELGRIAFEQSKYEAAATYFHEATISGAYFERYDVLEEAFRLGAEAHLLSGKKGTYPPLAPASVQISPSKARILNVSLAISLAEQLISAGELPAASVRLNQARGAIGRHEMTAGAIGSRLNYQTARGALHAGDLKSGAAVLATALTYQKAACKRMFHIGLADTAFRGGGLIERVADTVFGDVLREPTATDWMAEPLDTIAALTLPHPLPFEHWFELVLGRKEQDRALNIAERIRRHRFLASQTLGGRLLALRWVLEGPPESLSQEAMLQRQDLLVKFPKFADLSRRSAELRAKLEVLPIAPTEEAQIKQQQELFADLARVSAAQEALLQLIAIERVPSELAFPPLRDTKEVQQQLPDGTIVFYYFVTSRNVHAFALAKDRYAFFTVPQPAKVKADMAELLKQMGLHDRSQPVAIEDLKANGWRAAGQRLLAQLTNDAKPEEWTKYHELVIVPDGVLWYLPFEALPLPGDAGGKPLLTQLPVRYAPTLSLAVPDHRNRRPLPRTAIVAGKFLPREDDAAAKAALEAIAAAAGDCAVLRRDLPAPAAIFASTFDRLLVLADCDDVEKAPLTWSPFVLDAAKPGSTLVEWTQLPFGGVDQVILPGFHTPAEVSLKRPGAGDEIFMSICGLMASGCRTVLLSRWRVGGQSTADLMREFLQELPHDSADNAWRRSVQLASDRLLDPSIEPRLKAPSTSEVIKADHPFFWSGYLLVDTGVVPER